MKYRKRPVVVEATQWHQHGDDNDVIRYVTGASTGQCQHCRAFKEEHGWISTLEGGHIVCPGDFIITGVKGEKYPCKPDIFAATYEVVE